MSIQTQIPDLAVPPPGAKTLDKTSRRRLGLFKSDQRDRHSDLLDRLADAGGDALSDAELLELLISRSTPRTDARAQAQALLNALGDLGQVLAATHGSIAEIADVLPANDLKLIDAAARRLAKGRMQQKPLISSWDAVIAYCRTTLANRDTEEFRVLFLDRRNMLIADEVLGVGTVDHVPVYPREVLKRALALNACAMILVHNHPSGDPAPSECDIRMTKVIKQAAENLSITLHDHLIIGAHGETSLLSAGLI